MATTIIACVSLLVAIGSIFLRPIIQKKVFEENEKKKSVQRSQIAINNLKEKWLDYFRSSIAQFIHACENLKGARVLADSTSKHFPQTAESADMIEIERGRMIYETHKSFAAAEAWKAKVHLLFKKKSKYILPIEEILNDCIEFADNMDSNNLESSKTKLKKLSKEILESRWKGIMADIKVTEKLDFEI